MRIKLYHAYLAAAICALVGGLALLPMGAFGATTSNLRTLTFGYGDTIYNYDFENQSVDSQHVDWATSLLFYNNANINKVKNILSGSYWLGGSRENFFGNNAYRGTGWVWDQDGGEKTDTPSCLGSDSHYRVYAPPASDFFYNPGFGYYIFGTTHQDHHEFCNSWYDHSEETEHDIANKMSGKGYFTRYDYAWFYNAQFNSQSNHYWDNDGYATYIKVT
jgi:hypothetical protein